MKLYTHTSLQTFARCPERYRVRYVAGVDRDRAATALRLGTAFHRAMELRSGGVTVDAAVEAIRSEYATVPAWAEVYDWQVERETVIALVRGYYWRYQNDDAATIATELPFELKIPGMRRVRYAGKIDAIVNYNGHPAVREYKTTSEDIGPDSDYWLRLRADPQISGYVVGARACGHDCGNVLYDVTRKPVLRLRDIPLLDKDGLKIVVDAAGNRAMNKNGTPRQTTGDGLEMQTRPETAEEFGARVLADIYQRPDWYFARREIGRTDDELARWFVELPARVRAIRAAEDTGRWYRNPAYDNCQYCPFAGPCLSGLQINRDAPPEGYVALADTHPELRSNDHE